MEVDSQSEPSTGIVMFKGHSRCVWWKLRTRLEKFLICLWIITCALLFGLFVAIIVFQLVSSYSTKVCTTTACLNAASDIMKYIDQSVPPCDDFYKFACGGWLKTTVIPEDNNMISSFSVVQDKIDYKLRTLIESPSLSNESRTFTNIKNMYNSCLNTTAIGNYSSDLLLDYLRMFGGWPVVEGHNWNESNFDWIETIGKMRNLGFKHQFFLYIRVAPNLRRNTIHKIYLTEPTFGSLARAEFKNSVKVKQYLNFMFEVAVLLGAERDRAITELESAIRLESLIATIPEHNNHFDATTIKELKEMGPNTNWIKLINNVVSLNNSINETETVFVQNIKAVKALDAIFGKYQQNNKRALANYVIWRIVSQSLWTLDNRFIKLEEKFFSITRPQKRNLKRWKLCLSHITATMKAGVTSLYLINEQSREKSKYLANQILSDIQAVLIHKFDEIDWVDEETRSNAKFKAKSINRFISYSEELLNQTKIDEIYNELEELESDNLFMNVLRLRKWCFDDEYSRLRLFNNRKDWKQNLTPAVVNAYYSPFTNSIKIPAWILEGVFFNAGRPQYLNYGALGWIIGHESIHAFDNYGGRFDKRGNMRDWWDVESKDIFNDKSQCLVEQYQRYNLSYELNIDGKSTLSENIADNGGIDNAFRAYQQFVKRNGEELPLPGLQYSAQQLFWISAANIWCSKHTPEGYKNFVRNSIHSLSEYRVFVPFSNSKEFSKAFHCKQDDRMNPKHQCKVW